MLRLAGCEGLEQFLWYEVFDHYMISYGCKGSSSSDAWNRILFTIDEKFEHQGDSNVSFHKVVAKYKNEMAKSRPVTKDESCFVLASVQLVYKTMSVKQFPVSDLYLESLESFDSTDIFFNYGSILKGYKQRLDEPRWRQSLHLCRSLSP